MNALGPLAKGVAFLMGKQPEEERHPRGFLGLEWSEQSRRARLHLPVVGVLKGSPAAAGGLQSGDRILRIKDRPIEDEDGLASPWPKSGRAIPSHWSSAVARVPMPTKSA